MRNNAAKVMQKQTEENQSGTHRVAKKETTKNMALSMADALADILAWEIDRKRAENRV